MMDNGKETEREALLCIAGDLVQAEALKSQNAKLQARMDRAEGRVVDLSEALEDLIGAARGMPLSHDNLCQGTLDCAIEAAEETLASDGSSVADIVKAAREWRNDPVRVTGSEDSKRLDPLTRRERELLNALDRHDGALKEGK